MKSITTTKQELKELLEKGFFVRSEPVKKGEELIIENGSWVRSPYILNLKGKMVCQVGDVFSVKNKKGEKQWYCPTCKTIESFQNYSNVQQYCPNFDCKGQKGKSIETIMKPLLVRLDKIEEETIEQMHALNYTPEGTNWLKILKIRQLALETGAPYETEFWLKTFRRVEK